MSTPDLAARLAALDPGQLARLRAALPGAADTADTLTPGQQRLWDVQRQAPGRPVDVVCQAVRLTGGSVDPERLAEQLRAFAEAHEALRTTFEEQDGTVRPVVHEHLAPRIGHAEVDGPEQAHALARELAEEPFDLAAGPLLRAVVARDPGAGEHWLLVAVHNLVFDAWSFELLLDRLAADPDTDHDSAPAAGGFRAFARAQRAWCRSAAGQAAAAYWHGQLADPPPALPADLPRTAGGRRAGRRLEFTLPAAFAETIAATARADGATAYTGWLAVVWATLAEYSGREDTVLGTFTANRDAPGAADTVGYLLNVLPQRLRPAPGGGHRDRVRSIGLRDWLRHGAYPGELIARDCDRRIPGAHPLFDAVFVFDSLGDEQRRIQGAAVTTADVDKGTARYDLTFAVYPSQEGVTCWLEYDEARYTAATARRLVERFTHHAAEAAR